MKVKGQKSNQLNINARVLLLLHLSLCQSKLSSWAGQWKCNMKLSVIDWPTKCLDQQISPIKYGLWDCFNKRIETKGEDHTPVLLLEENSDKSNKVPDLQSSLYSTITTFSLKSPCKLAQSKNSQISHHLFSLLLSMQNLLFYYCIWLWNYTIILMSMESCQYLWQLIPTNLLVQ